MESNVLRLDLFDGSTELPPLLFEFFDQRRCDATHHAAFKEFVQDPANNNVIVKGPLVSLRIRQKVVNYKLLKRTSFLPFKPVHLAEDVGHDGSLGLFRLLAVPRKL
jgi:hypothetical protein